MLAMPKNETPAMDKQRARVGLKRGLGVSLKLSKVCLGVGPKRNTHVERRDKNRAKRMF